MTTVAKAPTEHEAAPAARRVTTTEEVDRVWRRNRGDLLKALQQAGGTHEEADILAGILAGELQLWSGARSAIVTELVRYPRIVALRGFLAGGELTELRAMEQELARRAVKAGIARLEIGGRDGWERALPGYRRLCVYLVKTIESRSAAIGRCGQAFERGQVT